MHLKPSPHPRCMLQATGCLELQIAELEGIAARARVQEPEFHGFIERLNDGGELGGSFIYWVWKSGSGQEGRRSECDVKLFPREGGPASDL